MQMQGQVKVQGHNTGVGWRLHQAEALRQAVLKGQTFRVHQLINEGVPLITDMVNYSFSSTLIIAFTSAVIACQRSSNNSLLNHYTYSVQACHFDSQDTPH